MIAICKKCHAEWHWSPIVLRCPDCGATEEDIEVYNEI